MHIFLIFSIYFFMTEMDKSVGVVVALIDCGGVIVGGAPAPSSCSIIASLGCDADIRSTRSATRID